MQNYRPTESNIKPLGSRDVIPPNRQIYELQLSYSFSLSKSGEITVNLPWLSNVLYESEFESQLWMLYNSHKQLLACGDAYPSKWTVKVDKEDGYNLRLHVRGENKDLLDKMTDLPLSLSFKLPGSVSVDLYSSFANASTNGKKTNVMSVGKGAVVPLYIGAINTDKYAKNSTMGQYLSGVMTLPKVRNTFYLSMTKCYYNCAFTVNLRMKMAKRWML